MDKKRQQIGIIGFGVFGRFMYRHLVRYFDIVVYDVVPQGEDGSVQFVTLAQAAACQVVIVAVPVQRQEALFKDLSKLVNPQALVLDVSSVKSRPVELMQQYLPDSCSILATHPLFGPQSGKDGIDGLNIVLWPVRIGDGMYAKVKSFLQDELKLTVIERSPEVHDREMSYVQSLTFFIGRALGRMSIPDLELKTATYQHLLDVQRIVGGDTDELFYTIQHENPYALDIRKAFLEELHIVQDDVESKRS
jgi:prephenate dehydrogenase